MAVAIITGAGSGIGAATARALSDRGDHVVCADVKLADDLDIIRADICFQ